MVKDHYNSTVRFLNDLQSPILFSFKVQVFPFGREWNVIWNYVILSCAEANANKGNIFYQVHERTGQA